MNWRRGFLRLWAVASVLWISLVSWIGYESVIAPRMSAAHLGVSGAHMFDDLIPLSAHSEYIWVAFLPVAIALFLGLMASWIIGGFRSQVE